MMSSEDKANRMLQRWGAEKLDEVRRYQMSVQQEMGYTERAEKLEAMIDIESISVEFNIQQEHVYSECTVDPAIQEILITGRNLSGEYLMWTSDIEELNFFDIIKEMIELADAIY